MHRSHITLNISQLDYGSKIELYVSPNMTDKSHTAICTPFKARDQNVFRQVHSRYPDVNPKKATPNIYRHQYQVSMSTHDATWNAPLYRDVSLVSSTPCYDPRSWEPRDLDSICDAFLDLPEDFIPPRHGFPRNPPRGEIPKTAPVDDESPLPDGFVHLQDMDVVCGRGAPTQVHPGNQAYRNLIQKYEASYLCAKRSDKPVIAIKVMETMKLRGVRFVRRDRHPFGLGWIVLDEDKIYDKVCQSLRDGAPELRRKLLATDAKKRAEQPLQYMKPQYKDQENCTPGI